MEQKEKNAFSFKSLKPKAVSLRQGESIRSRRLAPNQALPLVIEPVADDLDLADWAKGNATLIQDELRKYGALLFRGFKMESAPAFERFALTVCRQLHSENGEHPRETISGQVYTPVFYPPDKNLLWHNENSFNASWPTKILFCCLKPAERGGETPIADSRKVFQLIDRSIRDRFMQKGVMYLRNYGLHFGLDWQTVFQTTSEAEVNRYCLENGFDTEWKAGNSLRTRCVRPAIIRHPDTGELSWFNQAQHWHVSCLEPEVRKSLMSAFSEEDLPRHCYFGDGSQIEDSIMDEILAIYRELEVSSPWEPGDILLLDNMLTAHARRLYEGERKMLVAMGDMLSFADLEEG